LILFFIGPDFITLTPLGEEYELRTVSWHNLKIRLEFNQTDLQWGRSALVTRINSLIVKLTSLLSVQSHLRTGGTKTPLPIFQQVSMLKLRKLEMFLLESVFHKHKEYLLTIHPQVNKCASDLRQRLLRFHETVSGLLDL
jgi:hypothetical protein